MRQQLEAFGAGVARRPGYRDALIEVAVVTNAALVAHTLKREIGSDAVGGVDAVFGVYLLSERSVWAPRCGSDAVTGLAAPPVDGKEFAEFGDAVMRSHRVQAILGGT